MENKMLILKKVKVGVDIGKGYVRQKEQQWPSVLEHTRRSVSVLWNRLKNVLIIDIEVVWRICSCLKSKVLSLWIYGNPNYFLFFSGDISCKYFFIVWVTEF